jgi:hypothetical protein
MLLFLNAVISVSGSCCDCSFGNKFRKFFILFKLYIVTTFLVGRCSSVGIATGYGLDDSGFESRGGLNFLHLSRPALGPTQPLVQWVPCFHVGKERPGRDADLSPPSSAVGHERVELYLYFPYGPYGLYRASVPVQ